MTIAERIAQLRKDHGYSYLQIGARTGLSGGYMHHVETGKTTNPGIETLAKIARAYGMTLVELLAPVSVAETCNDGSWQPDVLPFAALGGEGDGDE